MVKRLGILFGLTIAAFFAFGGVLFFVFRPQASPEPTPTVVIPQAQTNEEIDYLSQIRPKLDSLDISVSTINGLLDDMAEDSESIIMVGPDVLQGNEIVNESIIIADITEAITGTIPPGSFEDFHQNLYSVADYCNAATTMLIFGSMQGDTDMFGVGLDEMAECGERVKGIREGLRE